MAVQLPAEVTIAQLPQIMLPLSGGEPIETIQDGQSVYMTVGQLLSPLQDQIDVLTARLAAASIP